MEESIRLRLVFEDRHILTKSQKCEGLKRSWLLITPQQHPTISDLATHFIHLFHLQQACPFGISLYIDGFVLPPFETTHILREKDLICVKKKGGTLSDVIKLDEPEIHFEEGVEKQPGLTGVKLLVSEEFENESRGYESEAEEEDEYDQPDDSLRVENTSDGNRISKKRKLSKKSSSSKRKKSKHEAPEKCPIVSEEVDSDVQAEKIESCQPNKALPKKKLPKKDKSSGGKGKKVSVNPSNVDDEVTFSVESLPTTKRSSQLQGNVIETLEPDGTTKVPSRSARRKKAKRQWLRELSRIEKDKLPQEQSPAMDDRDDSVEHHDHQPDSNSDAEDGEVVPVVIRPGHIRFEPLGKDHAVREDPALVETFNWNGITSKKKGQKWGTEKTTSRRRNDYEDLNQESYEMPSAEKVTSVNDPIDFDKLSLCLSLPKVGDVIAYRLLELSASWCPVASSFRVGKVSHSDPETNRVVLAPVPEYPIIFEDKIDEDGSILQPDTSVYGEDGSLEIEFSSLIDPRFVNLGNSDQPQAVTERPNEATVRAQDRGTVSSNKELIASTSENGEKDAWLEISQTLKAKKQQLHDERWKDKESSGGNSTTYRALKRGALGPTMAFLRSQNGI